MGINGINDYSQLFNSYRVPSIPDVSLDKVAEQDRLKKVAETQEAATQKPELENFELPNRSENAKLEDISLKFNKSDDFGYIGKDNDIYSLDVENAISDMQKDNILRQYQFYAGNSDMAIVNNADGVVIPKLF